MNRHKSQLTIVAGLIPVSFIDLFAGHQEVPGVKVIIPPTEVHPLAFVQLKQILSTAFSVRSLLAENQSQP